MTRDEVLVSAVDSILNCDEKAALEVAEEAIAEGFDPVDILAEGFSVGIRQVGDLFGRGEVFLPQLILSAEIMKKVGEVFDAVISRDSAEKKGKMVIATVEGDVHDIGKGIVISLLRTQGIEVIDLGRDVPTNKIIETAVDVEADIIGTSALLSTTLEGQKKLEDELRKKGLRERFKTMVGGAPCTQRWADKIGADAFGEDAAEAVTKALYLLGRG
ncbi:Trimethylamine corrinoid protein 1 [Syntrophaceticus schinkii]|uniref:Trimethylamine corrinoid protein 1 n=1 Tax=Syntrophaceticus schinkii TaxID=499207 RepID=A0A0B7MLY6_9FIRM|nr:Trimethylamine corrinoid protein 1 [Syntrophaceticus schinkii]